MSFEEFAKGSLGELGRLWESFGDFWRVNVSLGESGRVWPSVGEFESGRD